MNPFNVVKDFENAVAEYTGAPFVVATTSCTMALLLCLSWFKHKGFSGAVNMPRYSYVGVPASILNAGLKVEFRDDPWVGEYQLQPLPLWDSARLFTSGMYRPGHMQCTSHHWSKTLSMSQAGCVIHDDPAADEWLRRARFDGRTEGVHVKHDRVQYPSWHAYLSPEVAAHGLMRISLLPEHNEPLPWGPGTNSEYPDLSQAPIFNGGA